MKIENIDDYLQSIRDFESYRETHDLREELVKAFPIGTKLKACDGLEDDPMSEGMEVLGCYDTSDPYCLTFKVQSKKVVCGEVIAHRVERINNGSKYE